MHGITLRTVNNCLLRLDHNSDENREEDGATGPLAIVAPLLPLRNVSFASN